MYKHTKQQKKMSPAYKILFSKLTHQMITARYLVLFEPRPMNCETTETWSLYTQHFGEWCSEK